MRTVNQHLEAAYRTAANLIQTEQNTFCCPALGSAMVINDIPNYLRRLVRERFDEYFRPASNSVFWYGDDTGGWRKRHAERNARIMSLLLMAEMAKRGELYQEEL